MLLTSRLLNRLMVGSVILLSLNSMLRADGGAVRLRQRTGPYQVTVFTSPTPFRAGLVDVSVLVQNAATLQCVTEAQVAVRLTRDPTGFVMEVPATSEAATNKLLYAAVFELPEPGWWDVEVTIEAPPGPAVIHFDLKAEDAIPRWWELWPWFTWPVLVVALFIVHQILVQRRVRPATTLRQSCHSTGSTSGSAGRSLLSRCSARLSCSSGG